MAEGYPHQLAGEDADAPTAVHRRVFDMALRARNRERHGHDPLTAGVQLLDEAANWRLAGSIAELFTEANAADPGRNKASDGTIGDEAHKGRDSDHNAWVIVGGIGVVRAGDITNDPALDLPTVAERIRQKAHAGQLPMVTGGGYAILNKRITAEDWSGWKVYTGPDPHVSHLHVSVSLAVAQFDARTPWGVFGPAPAPAPTPPPPAPVSWTGPDLTGSGPSLRGNQGYNGPRVALWQTALAARYPAYAAACGQLVPDGFWGPVTTRWTAEYAHRSGIPESDGANIGPRVAQAAYRAGIRV